MEQVTFNDFFDAVFDSYAIEIDECSLELTNVAEADESSEADGIEDGALLIYSDNFGTIAINPDADIKFDPNSRSYTLFASFDGELGQEETTFRLLQLK